MDQKVIADHKETADNFNVFFANIGAKSSAGNNQSNCAQSYSDYLNNPTPHSFTLSTINESYILSIINKLKNINSSGNDETSNKLLKAIENELSKPLTLIIKQCLLTGIFPGLLKIAKVKPLFKRSDTAQLNNYRPISLLPIISKVFDRTNMHQTFERVIYSQLYAYFNDNNQVTATAVWL